jgi:hypothetical protein
MRYYIVNGIEISFFLMPVYMDDVNLRLCYMTLLYSFLTSEAPFYYTELKNRFLRNY